ncbi:histone deacetylase family protein [Chitinilyticum piscinae]|uniref:Histone deacetylase n=1 Tax=Chitinilyticum piscinae TaxID=2866724 RepID=A0A8J7K1E4_9NEIS|nr:histone deacetylase [Chitinilyticum piscinae]MBE9609086.1 histone deacetylase [Chitinilyticum piscinae]
MKIIRSDHYPLPLPAGHRFPAAKYRLLYEQVASFAAGLCVDTPLIDEAGLCLAHSADYVGRQVRGELSAAEQRVIGLPWSPELVLRSLASTGATLAACRAALVEGCGVSLAGGTHHAYADHGSGFCVFNDSAVALRVLQREGAVRRALVIDLDVHQGNGTAHMLREDPALFTFSMHGRNNFPFTKETSDWDIELDDGCDDASYLAQLAGALPALFAQALPELVIYLAGADSYAGDRLGKLQLSMAGLAERDRLVLTFCRRFDVPVAVTMAGGYAEPISDTVAIQSETVRQALAQFG